MHSFPPGQYTNTVTAMGFRAFTSLHNVLTVRAPLVVNATLELGAVAVVVQVEGSNKRIDHSAESYELW